jgi:hypothetical protein
MTRVIERGGEIPRPTARMNAQPRPPANACEWLVLEPSRII